MELVHLRQFLEKGLLRESLIHRSKGVIGVLQTERKLATAMRATFLFSKIIFGSLNGNWGKGASPIVKIRTRDSVSCRVRNENYL